jgi:outer membrane protein OmpA-like peptidoglycan-associated protein
MLEKKVNKQFIFLCILLALAPACGLRKARVPVQPVAVSVPEYYPTAATSMPISPSEDIGAFVLHDEENPFNAPVSPECKTTGEDTVVVRTEEPAIPDRYKDSVQYGFKKIYFKFNQYSIDPEQIPALEYNLQIARTLIDKGYSLVVEGHACNSAGSSEYNLMLSERRAASIKNYFIDNGVSKETIRTIGCGCEFPEVPRDGDRQAQAPNRRDVLYAYPSNEKPVGL